MLLSIGLILPMTDNVVNKINNHISRRELETDFTDNIPDDYIESKITKLKENQYVTDVYKIPSKLTFPIVLKLCRHNTHWRLFITKVLL